VWQREILDGLPNDQHVAVQSVVETIRSAVPIEVRDVFNNCLQQYNEQQASRNNNSQDSGVFTIPPDVDFLGPTAEECTNDMDKRTHSSSIVVDPDSEIPLSHQRYSVDSAAPLDSNASATSGVTSFTSKGSTYYMHPNNSGFVLLEKPIIPLDASPVQIQPSYNGDHGLEILFANVGETMVKTHNVAESPEVTRSASIPGASMSTTPVHVDFNPGSASYPPVLNSSHNPLNIPYQVSHTVDPTDLAFNPTPYYNTATWEHEQNPSTYFGSQ
jgi:hypothetical protein